MDGDPPCSAGALEPLATAVESARELLRSINKGSKLHQALKREEFSKKILDVTERLEESFGEISFCDGLDISEEVQEQPRPEHPQEDIGEAATHHHDDLKKENIALHEMVIESAGEPVDCLEEMSALLKQLNDWISSSSLGGGAAPEGRGHPSGHRFPVVPDDFWCPISREIMREPVTVSTGQTYERSNIQKWLDAGHKTCPRTQQHLSHTSLTPNYLLKSLISQWCLSNDLPSPRNQGGARSDPAGVAALQQRAAAGEIRLLAKRNAGDRSRIAAEHGAIPSLVDLLQSPDPRTQEHAVTALLNLSIDERNKPAIVAAGAIPEIAAVLKQGRSAEAKENAAAALFSLSAWTEPRRRSGPPAPCPPWRDAAAAVFNLSLYQPNKVRAVRAGIVPVLRNLLEDPREEMVDEALAILAVLAGHQEGRMEIEKSNPVPILLELARTSSNRNKEHAAAVLLALCSGSALQLKAAAESGAEESLKGLCESGTSRAKRKAKGLLELLKRS
ncbi:unnamed protein product [Spirodela intermedia]|uniref:RING-type E3 ubiquitin transferase n=1 Tax=Spirodela intermedia TaxID=51605 RepID=A0A7I8ICN7_SPIIN|nr:unnamed protein product [Spirodela intermedia]CAA6655530.1 unnamed protein product [Spirodela intermedia]